MCLLLLPLAIAVDVNTPVASWPFTSDADDSTGAYNGTGSGVSYSSSGALFDGSNDHITVPIDSLVDGTDNWSINMWIDPDVLYSGTDYKVIWDGWTTGTNSFYIFIQSTAQ